MQEILNFLTSDTNIQQVCKLFFRDASYTNIRISKSPFAIDKGKLYFLVNADKDYSGEITLAEIGKLYRELSELFKNSDFIIKQDDELEEEFQKKILANAIPLSAENMPKIKQMLGVQTSSTALGKNPKLSVQGEIGNVNVIITIPKVESSESEEEPSAEYYIDCALEYLNSIKKQKLENITQTTQIGGDKKKLSI